MPLDKVEAVKVPSLLDQNDLAAFRANLKKNKSPISFITERMASSLEKGDITQMMALMAGSTGYDLNKRSPVVKIYASFLEKAISRSQINLALQTENFLYSNYLKLLETEEDYNQLFSAISEVYTSKIARRANNSLDNSYGHLFVIHTPFLLAHVNPLLKMLEQNQRLVNQAERIGIVVLFGDVLGQFKQSFSDLGVNLYSLNNENSLPLKIQRIETLRRKFYYKHVIWQCTPIFLSFAARQITNLSWWSVKFHPAIFGLQNRIGSLGTDHDFTKFGQPWKQFTAPIKLKNLENFTMEDWDVRRGIFGSFARDELIDNQLYWGLVQKILVHFPQTKFHYASRSPIHEKWFSNSNSLIDRVIHLGWLREPEKHLKRVAFILDPSGLGHGNMAREALAAKIPVVFPGKHNGSVSSVMRRLVKTKLLATEMKTNQGSGDSHSIDNLSIDYNHIESYFGLIENLFFSEKDNIQYGKNLHCLISQETKENCWETFRNILDGEKSHAPE